MNSEKLYQAEDIQTMKLADMARLPGKNRVEELRNYAMLAGIKRIGIAHCVAVQKEAEALEHMLSGNFEVYRVDCKYGKIPSGEILGNEGRGISCNPAGQAQYLAGNNTELNIVMGLCVGHDLLFTSKSKAPSTTLIVKDREHRHNPIRTFHPES